MAKCMGRPQFTKSVASVLSCTEELLVSVCHKRYEEGSSFFMFFVSFCLFVLLFQFANGLFQSDVETWERVLCSALNILAAMCLVPNGHRYYTSHLIY